MVLWTDVMDLAHEVVDVVYAFSIRKLNLKIVGAWNFTKTPLNVFGNIF
jgi:hypothetical protein